ncbi:MAG: helix-turn-helix domain-containing protein [Aestuariibacter sp.]
MTQVSYSLFSMVLAVGIFHALFMSISLASTVKQGKFANVALTAVLALFAYDMLLEFALESRLITYLPKLAIFHHITQFLYGPLIYFYILKLIGVVKKNWSNWLIVHFIPASISLFIAILLTFNYGAEDVLFYSLSENVEGDAYLGLALYEFFGLVLGVISIGSYVFASFKTLYRHEKIIDDAYSYHESIDFKWVRGVLWFMTSLFLLVFFFVASSIYMQENNEFVGKLLYVCIVLGIFYLGFKGLKQPQVFSDANSPYQLLTEETTEKDTDDEQSPNTPEQEKSKDDENKSYQKTALSEEESKLICEEVKKLIVEEELFLRPKFSLFELAEISGFRHHYISQAINQNENLNFFNFINAYRIDYAKKLLTQNLDAPVNILDVAMNSGFNSKTSFYSAFKKQTYQTPTAYREACKQNI